MALIEFKDGRPVKGSLDGIEVVEIPEGVEEIAESAFEGQNKIKEIFIPNTVQKIGNYAFKNCSELEKLYIPDSVCHDFVTSLGCGLFTHCKNLKEVRLPYMDQIASHMFFNCKNLEKVDLSAGVNFIKDNTFSDCPNLKEVVLADPPTGYRIAWYAFESCPEDLKITFSGISMPYKYLAFTRTISDGLSLDRDFEVLKKAHDILQDDTFSPILVKKLCNAEHSRKLDDAAEKIKKSFQTIGFYDISDEVDMEAKEKLNELFKNNTASRGVVPRIIDALTITTTTLNVPPEDLVKSFENKKFRNAIIAMRTCHEGNHFFDVEATLFAMTFDINTIKQFILENPYKDYASVLLCKGYKDKKENCINAAKWIAAHPGSNRNVIKDIYAYKDFIQIDPDMTVDAVRGSISRCRAELEVQRVEKRYDDFKMAKCKCELPKVEVELGRYRAYIMDGQDPRQVMLGYDTGCCQHLDGAGETAMMYGLMNPNAGFFVIEDKVSGKILAQAETWVCKEKNLGVRGNPITPEEYAEDNNLHNCLNNAVRGYINNNFGCKGFLEKELAYHAFENSDIGNVCYSMSEGNCADIVMNASSRIAEIRNFGALENIAKFFAEYGQTDRINKYFRDITTDIRNLGDLENVAKCLTDKETDKINEYYFRDKIFSDMEFCLEKDGTLHTITHKSSNDLMLVFDNIEFAENRNIDQFTPILAKWCEAAPYKNIAMGNGYNAMNSNKIRGIEGIQPPIDTDYVKSVMGIKFSKEIIDAIPEIENLTFSDPLRKLEFKCRLYKSLKEAGFVEQVGNKNHYDTSYLGIGPLEKYGSHMSEFTYEIEQAAEKPYTDADESCSVLKFEGKVEPYFAVALEEYVSKQQGIEQRISEKNEYRGR